MKNALIALFVVVLLWLFFDKKTKTITAPVKQNPAKAPAVQTPTPVVAGGVAINPASTPTAPAVVPAILVPLLDPAPGYKVDPETTYTPPPAIAAAIEQKQAELLTNPYRGEALAKEAELQQQEADRQAATLLLRQIQQRIAEAEKKQQAIDAATLAAEAEAAEKARIANQAKAADLAYKAANSSQPIQYDASKSPELERLNAFLVVKDQILNSAIYEAERLTLLATMHNIEAQYRLAYDRRLRGESQDSIDNPTMVAKLYESTLRLMMASIERRYLANQSQQVNAVITAAPALNPDIAQPAPDYTSTMQTIDPESGAIVTQYRTKLIDTSLLQ